MTVQATPPRVRVIGAGAMGAGIAQLLATSGVDVQLADVDAGALDRGAERIATQLDREVTRGRLDRAAAVSALTRIAPIASPTSAEPCDVVIEAVVEDLKIKQDLFRGLEAVVGPRTVLATNTSSLSVTAIASVLDRPERAVGLHFFNPVPRMRLVEIVPGVRTAPSVVDLAEELVRRTGHVPVRTADTPGFLVNHAGRGLVTEALQILDEQIAGPVEIDAIARDVLGLRMGPFELLDLTGLDVSVPVLESIWAGFYAEPRLRPSASLRGRLLGGLLGRKTGEGFYRYEDGKKIVPASATVGAVPLDRPIWTDDSDLAALLDASGVERDRGGEPGDRAVVLVSSDGASVITEANRRGLPVRRACGVESIGDRTTRLVLAVHPGLDPEVGRVARAALERTGRAVSVVRDGPAGVAQRLLASVVNVAAGIAQARLATPDDIDTAVRLALGYPTGPLAWGDRVGADRILAVLGGLLEQTGDPRYRPSSWIVERVALGLALVDSGTTPEDIVTPSEE
ncbi:3-hydroxyacyl-CoA dehydrogenase [Micromonospora sp. NPDC049523]|uniref:3-hydroxyacyl-CoA dehydrogenase n=1 Tax=Micromonospora sp. NPDC049523 TaxID=3155921 RepID=UPI00342806BE